MVLSLEWFHYKYNELNGTNNIWVAYSGGIDSRVLLELCHQYIKSQANYTLQAIHINHGLQTNAEQWTEHCLRVCKSLAIPLHVMPIKLNINSKQSIEALARQARRTIWQALLPANATLLLAHHAEDQAETILYRLFRGAGPTGLSGMAEKQDFGKGILLKPLLQISKADIELFANKHKLTWVIDHSNMDHKFDRNFIRHAIIPTLTKRWPKVTDNIIRSGKLCANTMQLINVDNHKLLLTLAGQAKGTLAIKKLLALEEIRCFAAIRAWLENNCCQMPSYKQLKKIKHEVMLAKIDANPILNCSEYQIRRYRDDLYLLLNNEHSYQESFTVAVTMEQEIKLASGKIISIKKGIGQGLKLPEGMQGITLSVGRHGKKAKKIFQQYGVPPWQRHKYPLVFNKKSLLCIIGLWTKAEFIARSGQASLAITMS